MTEGMDLYQALVDGLLKRCQWGHRIKYYQGESIALEVSQIDQWTMLDNQKNRISILGTQYIFAKNIIINSLPAIASMHEDNGDEDKADDIYALIDQGLRPVTPLLDTKAYPPAAVGPGCEFTWKVGENGDRLEAALIKIGYLPVRFFNVENMEEDCDYVEWDMLCQLLELETPTETQKTLSIVEYGKAPYISLSIIFLFFSSLRNWLIMLQ